MGRGNEVYITGPGHVAKMAAMSTCDTNVQKFSRTGSLMILKPGTEDQLFNVYKVYINDYPGLTLTDVIARSISVQHLTVATDRR